MITGSVKRHLERWDYVVVCVTDLSNYYAEICKSIDDGVIKKELQVGGN